MIWVFYVFYILVILAYFGWMRWKKIQEDGHSPQKIALWITRTLAVFFLFCMGASLMYELWHASFFLRTRGFFLMVTSPFWIILLPLLPFIMAWAMFGLHPDLENVKKWARSGKNSADKIKKSLPAPKKAAKETEVLVLDKGEMENLMDELEKQPVKQQQVPTPPPVHTFPVKEPEKTEMPQLLARQQNVFQNIYPEAKKEEEPVLPPEELLDENIDELQEMKELEDINNEELASAFFEQEEPYLDEENEVEDEDVLFFEEEPFDNEEFFES